MTKENLRQPISNSYVITETISDCITPRCAGCVITLWLVLAVVTYLFHYNNTQN